MSMPDSGDADFQVGLQGRAREEAPPSLGPGDAGLWEKVLQQTAELFQSDQPLEAADREAIRAVARRHRGSPLGLDPVAIELVQAVIGTRFGQRPESAELWREMAACVAATILDDPVSQARLQALWVRLGDGAE